MKALNSICRSHWLESEGWVTRGSVLIIDACVLINLIAGGEIEDQLRATGQESMICTVVKEESIYLRSDDPPLTNEEITLVPLIESGLLGVCGLESSDEEELYVDYASQMDDGEAMSVSLALSRGWNLATDDRKARRLFLEAAGDPSRLTSTPEIIYRWAQGKNISSERLKDVLSQITIKACYRPRSTDSACEWWMSIIRGE